MAPTSSSREAAASLVGAGISIFATALSAITFLSIPAKAYAADWGMFMYNMTIILTVPVVINFYLPLSGS